MWMLKRINWGEGMFCFKSSFFFSENVDVCFVVILFLNEVE